MQTKLLIADDFQVVRAGTAMMLEMSTPGKYSIEFAGDYPETHDKIAHQRYDLLIVDIEMPGSIYKKMIGELKKLDENLKILVFSGYEDAVGSQYISEGADGFLNKQTSEQELLTAVETILAGKKYFSKEIAEIIITNLNKVNPIDLLSEREREVFDLLAAGLGNKEICNELNIRMSTVSTYKKKIFQKLNIKTLVELIHLHTSELPSSI